MLSLATKTDRTLFFDFLPIDLGTIRVPVLITFGDEDTSCPAAHGRFLAASVRGAVVVETKGGGHFAADPTTEIRETHLWLSTGTLPAPQAP